MIDDIANFFENKCRSNTRPTAGRFGPALPRHAEPEKREQRTGFAKVFRWPAPGGQTPQPTTVEVVGSFSGWRKVPLSYDSPTKTWQITLDDIEGNHTHRYVILVDGNPTYDKACDGLTAPQNPDEAKWGISTPKGLRVMLLFSQTK